MTVSFARRNLIDRSENIWNFAALLEGKTCHRFLFWSDVIMTYTVYNLNVGYSLQRSSGMKNLVTKKCLKLPNEDEVLLLSFKAGSLPHKSGQELKPLFPVAAFSLVDRFY